MNCQCEGIELEFNKEVAENDLASYLKKGPQNTTQQLVTELIRQGVGGLTLLDIGGGIGAIQYELLKAGVIRVTSVDASKAYIETARKEATRRGLVDKIEYMHGDFISLAEDVHAADIVTLDRVLCCYHNMEDLVSLSAARAGKLYGLVYPRDTWWAKVGIAVINFFLHLRRCPFRSFVHPTQSVEALLSDSGFKPRFYQQNWIWQVRVYAR